MAKTDIKKLKKELFDNYVITFSDLEVEINSYTRETMVDPNLVKEALDNLRLLDLYIQNTARVLSMAESPDVFRSNYRSQLVLVEGLEKALDRIKKEQPDLSLIPEYEKQLITSKKFLEFFTETRTFLEYPKNKKKYRRWVRNGLIKEVDYKMFKEIALMLSTLNNFLEDNF